MRSSLLGAKVFSAAKLSGVAKVSGAAVAGGALLLATFGACGGEWSASTDVSGGSAKSSSLLQLMVGANQRTAFEGVRRYSFYDATSATTPVLEYREQVFADGAGQYAIEPLDLLEPQLPPAPESEFLLQQKMRQRLMFRYRDFEIRDLTAFWDNYTAVVGDQTTVAGHVAEHLLIAHLGKTGPVYTVDVEPQTGLVLRVREERADGTLVSLSEYESLDLAPDLTGVVFSTPLTTETTLPAGSAPDLTGLGFAPPVPRQVPAGWSLHEVSRLVDTATDEAWAKLVYTDGVQVLFFLAAEPPPPGQQAGTSGPPIPPRLQEFTIGAWTVLQGKIAGHQIVVMGTAEREVLADLIRSSLP